MGSVRAAIYGSAHDIRLDFTTHMGALNPNSGQDTTMIFRFKRSTADPFLFGNGDAYYIGSYPPNPTHIRVEKSSVDVNVLQIYARMGDRSNGSCVISMCKNFTFVGQIVSLPNMPNPAPQIPDVIEIIPNLILTQLDLSSISLTVNQISGLVPTIDQAIGQSIGNTVAPNITLNPLNTGLGVYAIGSNGISNPLNGSNTIDVSQAGDGNINFSLKQAWLSALNTSFQSSLNFASQTYQAIAGFSSFQNEVNTAIDNINAQSQSIPNTVLLAYVGRDYVLQINQAPSTTTWIYLGYWMRHGVIHTTERLSLKICLSNLLGIQPKTVQQMKIVI